MCGIVAYAGTKQCQGYVLEGLSRLEYRGYDSVGFVCYDTQMAHLKGAKETGGVARLQKKLNDAPCTGMVGMGHTRWATHGVVNLDNAHPQYNCEKTVAVVHNGIIENFASLRNQLVADGHNFVSQTDTEVVAHLFGDLLKKTNNLVDATTRLCKQLAGAYALVIMVEQMPDTLILIRRRSPLVIGYGKQETFAASDYFAFAHHTRSISFLPDESFALMTAGTVHAYDFNGTSLGSLKQQTIPLSDVAINEGKQHFEHYMLKEIYEQKQAITRTIQFLKVIGSTKGTCLYNSYIWQQLGISSHVAQKLESLNIIAAGTSWHASRIAQFFFETVCKIPTHVFLASEFRYMPFFPQQKSLFLFVSQSGETADTIEAMRLVQQHGIPNVAVTNVAASTMMREASGNLLMHAGSEISVASTKAFSTQLATLYWLAHRLAFERGTISLDDMITAEEELLVAAEVLEAMIEEYRIEITEKLAPQYARYERFIFLGRHIAYPFAMEAALKLKEISYIFSQCYPAGELKHGPIALVDENTPVILFSSMDDVIYQKIESNAQEVKARKGHLVVFAFEGQKELISMADTVFILPKINPLLAPIAMTGLMQFFVYQITRQLNRPIDKPRNLAKSVTVE